MAFIANNWDLFSDMFSDPKAVRDTITRLNTLRGPIAHCSMLAEDEVLRLKLSLRDWFRLME
jgi:Swt1-like HEPN